MEDKYYTPEKDSIELQWEWQKQKWGEDEWIKEELGKTTGRLPDFVSAHDEDFNDIKYRCKYIDIIDIQECGWEYEEEKIDFFTPDGKYRLYNISGYEQIVISIWSGGWQTVFSGEIKNKSELLFIQKRLGINP